MPKVSFIVANYNHAEFIPWTLKSILQQENLQDIEVIIIDEYSTDK